MARPQSTMLAYFIKSKSYPLITGETNRTNPWEIWPNTEMGWGVVSCLFGLHCSARVISCSAVSCPPICLSEFVEGQAELCSNRLHGAQPCLRSLAVAQLVSSFSSLEIQSHVTEHHLAVHVLFSPYDTSLPSTLISSSTLLSEIRERVSK
jgi:hypothetical protein